MRSSYESYVSLCGCGSVGGRGLAKKRLVKTRPVLASWASEARLVCTVQLYISVRGDSTLMGNYTTITSSLIKLRATGLIQPCDPAVRAHSSLRRSDIIQSVLQRRTANWWCCYVYGSVSQLKSGLPLQSHVTPSNYSLMFPTLCYLLKCKYIKNTFVSLFWVLFWVGRFSKDVYQTKVLFQNGKSNLWKNRHLLWHINDVTLENTSP